MYEEALITVDNARQRAKGRKKCGKVKDQKSKNAGEIKGPRVVEI